MIFFTNYTEGVDIGVVRKKWWGHLKSLMNPFTADYSHWLNLARLTAQTAVESRLDE